MIAAEDNYLMREGVRPAPESLDGVEALLLTERAVEKHINSIFSKLGLTEEQEINRRVKATLLYLAEQG